MSIVAVEPQWAAGAVVLRGPESKRKILLVHRPAYDDWTLPKGKPRAGELLPATAVREVEEESAVRIRLGTPLDPIRYPVGSAMKVVSWWVGAALSTDEHTPNGEVDKVEWLKAEDAQARLTYSDERAVAAQAVALPATTPLVIFRHAKAARREKWFKPDALRPLNEKGRAQLVYVNQILGAFGVEQVAASPAVRCVQTLETYGSQIGTQVETTETLSQDFWNPRKLTKYTTKLAESVGAGGRPTAVCSHAPVISDMMDVLGIADRPLATAACVIAHVDTNGQVIRTEWHDTLRVKQ